MRRAEDSRPAAHPGSLAGDYAETEMHRHLVLNGNGADEGIEPDDGEDWVPF